MKRYWHKYKKKYRVKKRKSLFLNPYFWLVFLIIFLAGGGFYSAVFSSFFQVKQIIVSGNGIIPADAIKGIIGEEISQKIAVFSTKSIFLANLKDIKNAIKQKFPQIYQVNLTREFPGIIYAQIEERQAVGTWCYFEDCFSLDKTGVIFQKSEPQGAPLIMSQENNKQLELGSTVIDVGLLDSIINSQKKLKIRLGLIAEGFFIPEKGEKLVIQFTENWQAYFNLSGDFADQLQNLELVVETKVPLEKRGTLQYIDLRFGNKVYFKYQDQPSQSQSIL